MIPPPCRVVQTVINVSSFQLLNEVYKSMCLISNASTYLCLVGNEGMIHNNYQ